MNDPDQVAPDQAAHDQASRWWRAVEAEIVRRQEPGDGDPPLPDPWADAIPDVPALTEEQQDLLGGLADQPRVARLHGLGSEDIAGSTDDDLSAPDDAPDAPEAHRSPLAAILDRAIDDVGGTPTNGEPPGGRSGT